MIVAVGAGVLAATALLGVGAAAARSDVSGPAATAGRAAAVPVCTRYASPVGRDGAAGTKARPFKTAQRLADSLRPGQVGCLRGGVYDDASDGYVLKIERGGRPGAPIRLRSYPGERAKLLGTVYLPQGAEHVVLSRLKLEGTGDGNSIKIYSADVVLEENEITNAGRGESCMILGSTSGYGQAVRTVIRRNQFRDCGSTAHDNKDHAIYVSSTVGVQIVGNVFWNTAGYTIHFYPNARGTRVAHNVIDGGRPSVRGGVLFGGNDDYASRDNVVEHNVIAYAETANVTSGWGGDVGSGNVARRNCLWAGRDENVDTSDGGFASTGNVVAAPGFVDRARHDYRLRRGSRCLGVVGYDAAVPVRAARGK